jgi:hypothetical protein
MYGGTNLGGMRAFGGECAGAKRAEERIYMDVKATEPVQPGALREVAQRLEGLLNRVGASTNSLRNIADRAMGVVPENGSTGKVSEPAQNDIARLHDLLSGGEALASMLNDVTERLSRL